MLVLRMEELARGRCPILPRARHGLPPDGHRLAAEIR
jgi:hypothetical protein